MSMNFQDRNHNYQTPSYIDHDKLQAVIKQKEKQAKEEYKKRVAQEKRERRQKVIDKVKNIFAAIPLSVLGLLEFFIVDAIAGLAVALIHIIISYIPVLNLINEWFSRKAGSDITEFAICFGATFAYIAVTKTASLILKNEETRRFSLMFTGVLLVALSIIFLIINITNHDAIFANIIISIVGIVLFFKNKST